MTNKKLTFLGSIKVDKDAHYIYIFICHDFLGDFVLKACCLVEDDDGETIGVGNYYLVSNYCMATFGYVTDRLIRLMKMGETGEIAKSHNARFLELYAEIIDILNIVKTEYMNYLN